MKQFLAVCIGRLGAFLWEHGGWTGSEQYSDLTIIGKLGWRLFLKGFEMMECPMKCKDKHITRHFYDDADFWKESES